MSKVKATLFTAALTELLKSPENILPKNVNLTNGTRIADDEDDSSTEESSEYTPVRRQNQELGDNNLYAHVREIGTGQARIIESLVLTDAQINETKALALTGAIQGSTGDRIRRKNGQNREELLENA